MDREARELAGLATRNLASVSPLMGAFLASSLKELLRTGVIIRPMWRQDMGAAPKDGEILGKDADGEIHVAWWCDTIGGWTNDTLERLALTAWMPLPLQLVEEAPRRNSDPAAA